MRKILIAEDDENLREVISTTLEEPDYLLFEARDGSEALDVVRRERPDLVLLDWMMPGINGIDVLTALGADPATADIPVIMLTGRALEADRDRARALGATAFITKPFSPWDLLDLVHRLLEP